MTSFPKFIKGSKAYLLIDRKETLNESKVTCLDQNYTFANLFEKEVDFVKRKFLDSDLKSLKFFVIRNETSSTFECYDLLTKFFNTVILKEKCPNDYDYEDKSHTLCQKHILDVYNTTNENSYLTNQIIHTSNNTMIIIIAVVIVAVVLVIVTLCYLKRRNNNSSNEVSLIMFYLLLIFKLWL